MKPFRFTLQALRALRQRREQAALAAYARTLSEQARALDRWQAAERGFKAAEAEWRQQVQAGCSASLLTAHALHCQALAGRCEERLALLG